MAKSKSSKNGLIFAIVIIALAVLTICTIFMPVISVKTLLLGSEKSAQAIAGTDIFSAAFAGVLSTEMSAGTVLMYGLKTAEDTAFVTNLFMWLYMLTVVVSFLSLIFAIFNIIGLKFRLLNLILGIALVVLAIATFIFAIVVAGKFTALTGGDKATGIKGVIAIGTYLLIGSLACGGLQAYTAKQK